MAGFSISPGLIVGAFASVASARRRSSVWNRNIRTMNVPMIPKISANASFGFASVGSTWEAT